METIDYIGILVVIICIIWAISKFKKKDSGCGCGCGSSSNKGSCCKGDS